MVWFYHKIRTDYNDLSEYPFNPTMVWFYHVCQKSCFCFYIYAFNPTMVWFYLSRRWRMNTSEANTFNPTMVWFYQVSEKKGGWEKLSIPLWSDFIFALKYVFKSLNWLLSIPLWSDFISTSCKVASTTFCDFQSHYGLILSQIRAAKANWTSLSFQSHYGLILSDFSIYFL